jgi:hypothetical protein
VASLQDSILARSHQSSSAAAAFSYGQAVPLWKPCSVFVGPVAGIGPRPHAAEALLTLSELTESPAVSCYWISAPAAGYRPQTLHQETPAANVRIAEQQQYVQKNGARFKTTDAWYIHADGFGRWAVPVRYSTATPMARWRCAIGQPLILDGPYNPWSTRGGGGDIDVVASLRCKAESGDFIQSL